MVKMSLSVRGADHTEPARALKTVALMAALMGTKWRSPGAAAESCSHAALIRASPVQLTHVLGDDGDLRAGMCNRKRQRCRHY